MWKFTTKTTCLRSLLLICNNLNQADVTDFSCFSTLLFCKAHLSWSNQFPMVPSYTKYTVSHRLNIFMSNNARMGVDQDICLMFRVDLNNLGNKIYHKDDHKTQDNRDNQMYKVHSLIKKIISNTWIWKSLAAPHHPLTCHEFQRKPSSEDWSWISLQVLRYIFQGNLLMQKKNVLAFQH